MAKGFDKSIGISKKKLRRYAPLTRQNNGLIRILEKTTDCVYGEDFILNQRINTICAKPKLIEVLHELQNELDNDFDESSSQALELIINATEETKDLEESEFLILITESLLWNAYKLLHNGCDPRIEKDLCIYTEEEISELDEKIIEVSDSFDDPDEVLDSVVIPFIKYLKNQGYFYHFINYELTPSN
jgi:hypothetical protein